MFDPINHPRNLACLYVTGEQIQEMFRTSSPNQWFSVLDGIPDGAKFVRMDVDTRDGRSLLCLVYEHPSFSIVYPGQAIPSLITPIIGSIFDITVEDVARIHKERQTINEADTPTTVTG